MYKTYLIVLTLLLTLNISAQNDNQDISKITTTIENYYYGYIERDINKLNLAFDTINGTLKAPGGNNDGTEAYKNLYFKDLIPKWGNREKLSAEELSNCTLNILNIDVHDAKMATAKISMKVDRVTYVDILSLQKMNTYWKITNKMFLTYKSE